MCARRQIPVGQKRDTTYTVRHDEWITHPDGTPEQLRHEEVTLYEDEWDITHLDDTTLVIVTRGLHDVDGRRHRASGARVRPCLSDPEAVIIEPHAPYFKRTFRKTKLMQARWAPDHTITRKKYKGQADNRCKKCKREQRRMWWRTDPKHCLFDANEIVGCPKHVQSYEVEVPHPDAGRVFAVFSSIKLKGLPPGTEIIAQVDGVWGAYVVRPYPAWTEAAAKAARRTKREAEAAAQLKAQKAKSAEGRRKRFRYRRYLKQPTWHERLDAEDFGVEE